MLDTNQLLSIAFSLIANFTNVVHVPPEGVPHSRADLTRIGIINPTTRFDLWLEQRNGYQYWIRDGVVQGYASPNSFFRDQGLDVPARLRGEPTLSSNQVVELATGILGRLRKIANPAEKSIPTVKTAGPADLPFYRLRWPVSTNANALIAPAADVEVDARDGTVVAIELSSSEYYDPAFAREISNRVYTPPPPRPPKPPKKPGQDQWTPTTDEVQTLVPRWLNFCKRLGLDPGNQTNVAEVDWDPTFKTEASPPLPRGMQYKIQFRNGCSFNCVDQRVFGHRCGDAAFVGAWADQPPDYWTNFVGKSVLKWQNLAAELNARLVSLGVSSNYLRQYTPDTDVLPAGGVNRVVVYWYDSKGLEKKMDKDRIKTGLLAEFDLATGQIKNLQIFDFNLLKWENPPEPKEK